MSNVSVTDIDGRYYSQRDNELFPITACGITTCINAGRALNHRFPAYEAQPEDALLAHIYKSEACHALYATKDEAMCKANPIHTWQDIIALGYNEWVGKQYAHFYERAPMQFILYQLLERRVCGCTGRFATVNSFVNHTFTVLGATFDREVAPDLKISNIRNFIVRDSWGNYLTKYVEQNGKRVEMPYADFMSKAFTMNANAKWCIVFKRKEEV